MTEEESIYYLGKLPCPRGHTWRYKSSDRCVTCSRESRRQSGRAATAARIPTKSVRPAEAREGRDYQWMTEAACLGEDTELWFAAETEQQAKDICERCPVRQQCLSTFLNEAEGVFGGLSRKERQKLEGGKGVSPTGPPGEALCNQCHRWLPEESFNRRTSGTPRYKLQCKACERASRAEREARDAAALEEDGEPEPPSKGGRQQVLYLDERQAIVAAYTSGNFTTTELAEKYDVSRSTVWRVLKKYGIDMSATAAVTVTGVACGLCGGVQRYSGPSGGCVPCSK